MLGLGRLGIDALMQSFGFSFRHVDRMVLWSLWSRKSFSIKYELSGFSALKLEGFAG